MIPVLRLPTDIRFDFARPRAPIHSGDFTVLLPRGLPSLACVGDVVSSYCARRPGIAHSLVLVLDGKTRRTRKVLPVDLEADRKLKIVNPPGTISLGAARTLCDLLERRGTTVLLVDGEEDMLALPAIACSPLGGAVVYGIPGRGATIILVDRRVRGEAGLRLLSLKPGLFTG
ncbi:MAG: DUF359 domain-containing protein [Desulfurococcales archaeon]|nr:DUF359 domain-containing protein [Desulfurococcales archaeon]